jgi:hypothetical protein
MAGLGVAVVWVIGCAGAAMAGEAAVGEDAPFMQLGINFM